MSISLNYNIEEARQLYLSDSPSSVIRSSILGLLNNTVNCNSERVKTVSNEDIEINIIDPSNDERFRTPVLSPTQAISFSLNQNGIFISVIKSSSASIDVENISYEREDSIVEVMLPIEYTLPEPRRLMYRNISPGQLIFIRDQPIELAAETGGTLENPTIVDTIPANSIARINTVFRGATYKVITFEDRSGSKVIREEEYATDSFLAFLVLEETGSVRVLYTYTYPIHLLNCNVNEQTSFPLPFGLSFSQQTEEGFNYNLSHEDSGRFTPVVESPISNNNVKAPFYSEALYSDFPSAKLVLENSTQFFLYIRPDIYNAIYTLNESEANQKTNSAIAKLEDTLNNQYNSYINSLTQIEPLIDSLLNDINRNRLEEEKEKIEDLVKQISDLATGLSFKSTNFPSGCTRNHRNIFPLSAKGLMGEAWNCINEGSFSDRYPSYLNELNERFIVLRDKVEGKFDSLGRFISLDADVTDCVPSVTLRALVPLEDQYEKDMEDWEEDMEELEPKIKACLSSAIDCESLPDTTKEELISYKQELDRLDTAIADETNPNKEANILDKYRLLNEISSKLLLLNNPEAENYEEISECLGDCFEELEEAVERINDRPITPEDVKGLQDVNQMVDDYLESPPPRNNACNDLENWWGVKFTFKSSNVDGTGGIGCTREIADPNREITSSFTNEWVLTLLPAMRSVLPSQGSYDTPNAMPGLQFQVRSNIAKHSVPGFQPLYQHMGVDNVMVTMIGTFTGDGGLDAIYQDLYSPDGIRSNTNSQGGTDPFGGTVETTGRYGLERLEENRIHEPSYQPWDQRENQINPISHKITQGTHNRAIRRQVDGPYRWGGEEMGITGDPEAVMYNYAEQGEVSTDARRGGIFQRDGCPWSCDDEYPGIGPDGAMQPINQGNSDVTNTHTLLELASHLDAYHEFTSFYRIAVQQGHELEIEINMRKNRDHLNPQQNRYLKYGKDATGMGHEESWGPLRNNENGNPKFKAVLRNLETYYARSDRAWYIMQFEVTDYGLVGSKPINLTKNLEEATLEAIQATRQQEGQTRVDQSCLQKIIDNKQFTVPRKARSYPGYKEVDLYIYKGYAVLGGLSEITNHVEPIGSLMSDPLQISESIADSLALPQSRRMGLSNNIIFYLNSYYSSLVYSSPSGSLDVNNLPNQDEFIEIQPRIYFHRASQSILKRARSDRKIVAIKEYLLDRMTEEHYSILSRNINRDFQNLVAAGANITVDAEALNELCGLENNPSSSQSGGTDSSNASSGSSDDNNSSATSEPTPDEDEETALNQPEEESEEVQSPSSRTDGLTGKEALIADIKAHPDYNPPPDVGDITDISIAFNNWETVNNYLRSGISFYVITARVDGTITGIQGGSESPYTVIEVGRLNIRVWDVRIRNGRNRVINKGIQYFKGDEAALYRENLSRYPDISEDLQVWVIYGNSTRRYSDPASAPASDT